jgi:hypothetical protein
LVLFRFRGGTAVRIAYSYLSLLHFTGSLRYLPTSYEPDTFWFTAEASTL